MSNKYEHKICMCCDRVEIHAPGFELCEKCCARRYEPDSAAWLKKFYRL